MIFVYFHEIKHINQPKHTQFITTKWHNTNNPKHKDYLCLITFQFLKIKNRNIKQFPISQSTPHTFIIQRLIQNLIPNPSTTTFDLITSALGSKHLVQYRLPVQDLIQSFKAFLHQHKFFPQWFLKVSIRRFGDESDNGSA